MPELLKGAPAARALTEQLTTEAEALKAQGFAPCLCVIRLGERPDDIAYENGISKRCESTGIALRRLTLDADADTETVLNAVRQMNADSTVHGVLIMRPLPRHVDDAAVCAALDPRKDVDGITAGSMAMVYSGRGDGFAPCTAEACVELLDYNQIGVAGKNIAIVGRSLVIGRPLALLLVRRDATVTVCHTKTADVRAVCRGADIVVAAAGVPRMIDGSYLSAGQTVLDVGINVDADGNLCGDVDFESAAATAAAITPVPGGVGTVTSAVLARHVVQAARRAQTEAKPS